jgi:hypothetical protein
MRSIPKKVRVIRDPRDATRDYWLDPLHARELYNAGKLHWSLTNECYIEPRR